MRWAVNDYGEIMYDTLGSILYLVVTDSFPANKNTPITGSEADFRKRRVLLCIFF